MRFLVYTNAHGDAAYLEAERLTKMEATGAPGQCGLHFLSGSHSININGLRQDTAARMLEKVAEFLATFPADSPIMFNLNKCQAELAAADAADAQDEE